MSSKMKKNSRQFLRYLPDQHPDLHLSKRGPSEYEMTSQIYENSPRPSQILSSLLPGVLAFVNNISRNIPPQLEQQSLDLSLQEEQSSNSPIFLSHQSRTQSQEGAMF
jgi:hypothetical protein